jgi:hypothetical protein
MLTVEAARGIEIRNSFQEGSLLVPVAMRLVLGEDVWKMSRWGDDPRWVGTMLGNIGVSSTVTADEVMEIIKAGKRSVWHIDGRNSFEAMIGRIIGKSDSGVEVESKRIILVGLALKATVMAMVGGDREEYMNQMVVLKSVQQEPEFLGELLGQLEINVSNGRRGRLVELLNKIDLD